MKYLVALIAGMAVGVALFLVGMIYNPFTSESVLSPISVTSAQTITLGYSAVATDNIVFTNNGESRVHPYPEKVLQLWESPVRQTSAMATVLRSASNQVAGLGIKMASRSEKTQLLGGDAIVDTVWYVYLPGKGSLFIEQTENYWSYIREIVVPAYRSSSDTWRGSWLRDITSGPGSLNTARVTGGSGEFQGAEMLAVESLSVQAWSVDDGPISAAGRMTIELPQATVADDN